VLASGHRRRSFRSNLLEESCRASWTPSGSVARRTRVPRALHRGATHRRSSLSTPPGAWPGLHDTLICPQVLARRGCRRF